MSIVEIDITPHRPPAADKPTISVEHDTAPSRVEYQALFPDLLFEKIRKLTGHRRKRPHARGRKKMTK